MRGLGGVSRGGAAVGPRGGRGAARSVGGFSVGGSGAAAGDAATAATVGSAPAGAVGLSLLAAQENEGRAGRDTAARRRAAALLDELQGLQDELLGGRPDPARMARLAALQIGEEGTDPALREAVRAVALRARIELTRRTSWPRPNRSAAVS